MKVTVYSTKGQQKYEHVSSATTWGALKEELFGLFDFNSLNATENITRRDLTVDSATLPEQDFTLFLRPRDTKSGAWLSYKTVKDIIKNDKALQEKIKTAYATDYTHLSTGQMNEALERFGSPKEVVSEDYKEEAEEEIEGDEEEIRIGEAIHAFLNLLGLGDNIGSISVKVIYKDSIPEPQPFSEEEPDPQPVSEEELELIRLQKEADELFNA